ncbi:MAG: hypothetical protein ACUVWO_12845 [Thermodesulfobacteriota bacterium]
MAKMVTPAGDMEVKILEVNRNGNTLTLTGQMGIWDAKIYLEPREVIHTVRLMMNVPVLLYILKLPFAYFAEFGRERGKIFFRRGLTD